MTIAAHITQVRNWLNVGSDVYPDDVVTGWTRFAEQKLTDDLRVKEMITIDELMISTTPQALPADWEEFDFVKVKDGDVLSFRAREEYFTNDEDDPNYNSGHYTLAGSNIFVGPYSGGPNFSLDIHYFSAIPELAADAHKVYDRYSMLYTLATLLVGAMYAYEDERAVVWQAQYAEMVEKANDRSIIASTAGSKLSMPRKRGFG